MKVIRDKTKQYLESRGAKLKFGRASESERETLLAGKLSEEIFEWLQAGTREQALKELGDMTEIVWAMAKVHDISESEVIMQASGKRRERGGFDGLTTLEVELTTEGAVPSISRLSEVHWQDHVADVRWYSG